MTASSNGPLRVGVGGPVGSGKTALMEQLCKRLRSVYDLAAITNDIYTKEDARILTETGALEAERIAMAMPAPPGRVESSRITPVAAEDDTLLAEEVTAVLDNPIIDVHEEPLAPPPEPEPVQYRGSHRRPADAVAPQPVPVARPAIAEPVIAEPIVVRNSPPPTEPAPQQPEAPWRPPEVRRGRHWSAGDSGSGQTPEPDADPGRGRHRVPPEPAVEEDSQGSHTGGQSVADLMSRLKVNGPAGGGGRRRRED